MAETALYLALRKIALVFVKRNSSDDILDDITVFVGSRLRRIESELRMMHCFLGLMETRYNNNQVLVSWIAEARKLGCRVEETVDQCIHVLDGYSGPSEQTILWSLLGGLAALPQRRQIAIQLEELESELEHLSKMKKRWVQVDNGDPYVSAQDTASTSYQQLAPRFIIVANKTDQLKLTTRLLDKGDKSEKRDQLTAPDNGDESDKADQLKLTAPLLDNGDKSEKTDQLTALDNGDESDKTDQLTAQLVDNGDEPGQVDMGNKSVVAVWGPGGSGKTTLVQFVYEDKRRHFDCHAWISMSGCSSAEDTLIRMRRELRLEGDTAITCGDNVEYSVERLRGLTEKKFLIVFDDVEVTGGIAEILSGNLLQMGSRIIIITRIKEIATQVDHRSMMLGNLNYAGKLNLLQTVASGKMSEEFTTELAQYVCSGLPQVIVSLGASLSLKQQTLSAMKQYVDQLEWVEKHNSSLNDTHRFLYVSYNNLPMHLRTCLLYCGIFPAGYLLLCEKLVRLWAAEGFIEKQRASELEEEIAEGYLIELTWRGFLQRVDSDELGRVASCRMPITVHELIQSICRKEGFGIACKDAELPQADTDVRCLFVSKHREDFDPTDFPNLRTLILDDIAAAESPHPINLVPNINSRNKLRFPRKRLRYLTVLDLQGSHLRRLPYSIGNMFNLRYLGLSKTEIRSLPDSIRRLQNMQTLDLKSSCITELPNWIGKLARLRHLLAGCSHYESHQRNIPMGVEASVSLTNLEELQTLETVEASASFLKRLDMLTMLRSLCISNVESKSWRTLCASVSKLCSLSRLSVCAKDENEVQNLDLLKTEKLKSLKLSCCKLGENSLELLSANLPNLVSLNLHKVRGVTSIKFQENSFKELRTLVLREIDEVDTVNIPGGALEKLEVLHVESLQNLKQVQDLKKFQSIKDLYFLG